MRSRAERRAQEDVKGEGNSCSVGNQSTECSALEAWQVPPVDPRHPRFLSRRAQSKEQQRSSSSQLSMWVMKNFKQLILLSALSFIRSDDQSLKQDIFNRDVSSTWKNVAAWRLLLVLLTSRSHAAVGRHHIFQLLQISQCGCASHSGMNGMLR